MIDVAIAGGGIAGSALAILLGRAGMRVGLYEKSRFLREKPCGEGIMPAGVAALERLGVASAVAGERFYGIRYHAGSVTAEARFPRVAGLPLAGRGQRRLYLDRTLFECAASTAGVIACEGTVVEAPLIEDGKVRGVVVAGQVCRARLTVIADGAGSSLRRRLGLDGPLPGRIRTGIRTHFRLATGHLQPALVEVYLGRGYELYVTPLPEGEVLVAALAEAGAASTGADRCIARWIGEQPDLAQLLVGAARVSPYLGRSPLARSSLAGFAAGAVLLGDAAGYLDPITGGGISQALLTAELLAQQMPGILSGGDAALATFDRDRRGLLRDYVLLTRLVLGLSRRPAVAKASIHVMRALPPLFSHMVGVAGGVSALLPGRADSHSAHGEPVEP